MALTIYAASEATIWLWPQSIVHKANWLNCNSSFFCMNILNMGFVVKLLLLSECTDHFKSQMVNFPSQRLRPFIAILYHHHSSSCLCMKPLLLCDCPHPLQSWVGDPQRSQQAVVGVDQALTKSDSFSFCSEKTPLYLQRLELCAAPLELLLPALL